MAFDAQTIFIIPDTTPGPIRAVRAVVIPQGSACLVDGKNQALPGEGLVNADDWRPTLKEAVRIAEKRRDVQIQKMQEKIDALMAIDFDIPAEG